jgi:epoxyqueuosine reductase
MSTYIKQAALSVGFDACGIARAEALTEDAEFLHHWLEEGRHGEMHYLSRNFEKRTDPRELVPGCKSVVVVLLNYYPSELQESNAPRIAKYAYSETDYHTVIKAKLSELEKLICEAYGADAVLQHHQHSFVDSAPVLERRWAQRAGLGWIGKHTQLIHPGLGSYCFIGILMLNVETETDEPIRSRCGGCTRCMDACPTKAINNGTIDARRCISYLTIENKASIPAEFHDKLSGCALGCDICADVCPWNKKWAVPHSHPELAPVPQRAGVPAMLRWDRSQWEQFSLELFSAAFRKSAVKRAGYLKLKENLTLLISPVTS